MTPRRLATLARIWVRWAGGKTSSSRLRVVAASLVCMVPMTRCPVSEALMAISMVSRSRSSPMTMTSGSSRRAPLSAVKNDGVRADLALGNVAAARRLDDLDGVLDGDGPRAAR